MGRSPCGDDELKLKKGPWMPEEDKKLVDFINKNGHGSWKALPKRAGLNRCGKSCRLRWANYLRPGIKRGKFSEGEERTIINLHSVLGNKWSRIAMHLPERTDNEIKNFWNTHLKKKLFQMGIDPITHKPRTDLNLLTNLSNLLSLPNTSNHCNAMAMNNPWENTAQLAQMQLLQNLIQTMNYTSPSLPNVGRLFPNQATTKFYNPVDHLVQQQQLIYQGVMNTTQQQQQLLPNDQNEAIFNSLGRLDQGDFTSSYESDESLLPPLVSVSTESSGMYEMMGAQKMNPLCISTDQSPNDTVYEDWGLLMDEQAVGDSFWRDIFNETSPLAIFAAEHQL